MADTPERRPGIFGVSFLVVLVVVTLLSAFLIWSRGCDGDPLDAPEQLEVEDVTDAVRPAAEAWAV